MSGFKNQVEKLKEYIRTEQEKTPNGWVIITHRDVPNITGYSQYYTNRAFEALKNDEHVAYRIATNVNKPNKPFEFRVADSVEEKMDLILQGNQCRYLDAQEVATVKERLDIGDSEDLLLHLRILDHLCSNGIKEKPIEPDFKKMATYFVLDIDVIEDIFFNLLERNILEDYGKTYGFTVNKKNVYELQEESLPENNRITEALTEVLTEAHDKKHCSNNNNLFDLIYNIENMIRVQNEFKSFFEQGLKDTIETSKGYEALKRAAEEDQRLRNVIDKLEQENNILVHSLEKKEAAKDAFITKVQSRLEILTAEITNAVSQYVNIPAWQKGPEENARFQNRVISAVSAAIDDIVND